MDENKSFSDIIGPQGSSARRHAPFLNHLARVCGLAANYRGITHPSHPNYMAITGGVRRPGSSEGPEHLPPTPPLWRDMALLQPIHASRVPANGSLSIQAGTQPGHRLAPHLGRLPSVGRQRTRAGRRHRPPRAAGVRLHRSRPMPQHARLVQPGERAPSAPATTGSASGSDDSSSSPATPPDVPSSSSPGTRDHTAKAPTSAASTASHRSTATTRAATSPPSSSPPAPAPGPVATTSSATTRSCTPPNDCSDTTATSDTPTTPSPPA